MQTNKAKRRLPHFARGFAALCAALAVAAAGSASAAPTETVLHSFTGGVGDGIFPFAGLIADSAGNLYGTTNQGGGSECNGLGCGVVFKLSPGGSETVLHSFCSLPGCRGGANPVSGLIADRAGDLYGTTPGGGAANDGVVFKLSPGGTETVLYSFCGKPGCSDGAGPGAGLIADRHGNLYGTTGGGGGSGCGGVGCGVVFKLSPPILPATKWTETVLHTFAGSDGAGPGGLIADSKGNLYGTTSYGGASDGGVVFKLAPNGTETVLYSFCSLPSCSDGALPLGGLIADRAGNLYGTTYEGGGSECSYPGPGFCGVVFKLSPGGTETVLHSFAGGDDGELPEAGLIADASGNLYGTTMGGGATGCPPPGCGVVFKLSPGGTETVLHAFCSLPGCGDGAYPTAGLIADSAGNLYGTASGDDPSRMGGVVFKLAGTGFVAPGPSAPSAVSLR
ncbi:MAG: choice-of-anchor tandem repeat GloVer-containing protein [Methylocella sp.]